jgi:hypothetical protein
MCKRKIALTPTTPPTPMDSNGLISSMDSYGLKWTPIDSYGLLWSFVWLDQLLFLKLRLLWTPMDSHELFELVT